MEETSKPSISNAFFLALLSSPRPDPDQTLDSFAISDDESVGNWPAETPPAAIRRRSSSSPSSAPQRISAAESKFLNDGFPSQSLLLFAGGLVIKALFFQINLLICPFMFPIWLLYRSFLLVINPFRNLKCVRDGVLEKVLWISKGLVEKISSILYEKFKNQQKLGVRLAWGVFWSFYVLLVLLGLLMTAFIAGRMVMRRVVEEPVMVMENLNFDYTKASPEAFSALGKWDGIPFGLDGVRKVGVGKYGGWRFVPPIHKLKLTISLTLPESDYNQKVGVFQVRGEFLSGEGQVMDSSSHPCMLRFKSSPLRFLQTFFKSGYLLAGYSLESQTLSLEMTGFTEGTEPTACIRVILEQRAEYKAGAGIPEIYAASLRLESELPLYKRTIWNWWWTVFIWVSMGFFMLELSTILVCCRPVIIPKARSRHISY